MAKKKRRRKRQPRSQAPAQQQSQVQALMKQGQWAAAEPLLRSLLKRAPNNDEVRRDLARCLWGLGQIEECAQEVQSLTNPGARDTVQLGVCALELEHWEQAQQWFGQAAQAEEVRGAAYEGQALALAAGRHNRDIPRPERERIIALLRQALGCPDCSQQAARWLTRIVYYNTPAHQFLAVYDEVLAQHDDFRLVRYEQVEELLAHGETERAEAALQPLLAGPGEIAPRSAWWGYRIAQERGDWAAAIAYLETIPDPATDLGPAAVRGDLFWDAGEAARAAEHYGHEAERENASLDAQLYGLAGRALARLTLHDGDSALQDITRFVQLWRNYVDETGGDVPYPGTAVWIGDVPESYYRNEGYTFTDLLIPLWEAFSAAPTSPAAHTAALLDCSPELHGWLCFMYYEYSGSEHNEDYLALVEAAAYLDDPLVRYALMRCHAARGEWAEALAQYLAAARQEVGARGYTTHYAFYEEEGWQLPEKLPKKVQRALLRCGEEALATASPREVRVVLLYFYRHIWRPLLLAAGTYRELITVTTRMEERLPPDDPERWSMRWDRALGHLKCSEWETAATLYREYLGHDPDSSATLHNLSLAVQQLGNTGEAQALADRAAELAPDDELIVTRSQKLAEQEETRRRQAERQEDFLRTARDRWPKLDRYKRQLVAALTVVRSFDGWDDLARLTGQDSKYLPGHWRKLVEAGMIIEGEGGKSFRLNPHIRDLADLERSHSLVAQIVRANPDVRFKPMFNSLSEYTIYRLLVTLFPNHLVCPNVAPLAIFSYDRMREVLSREEFDYFLKCLVDFVIVNTTTYFPILAFEVDSIWHDGNVQQARDEKKNRIFHVGGVNLIRLRAYGQPSEQAMRQQIGSKVQALLASAPAPTGPVDLVAEIEAERFADIPLLPTVSEDEDADG